MRYGVKLGRTPSGPTPHLPALSAYLPEDADADPGTDWGRDVAGWPMLMNQSLGCCTIAGLGHLVQAWGAYHGYGQERIMSDDEVVAAYRQLAGYDGTPATDRGATLADVLTGWAQNGVSCGGVIDVPSAFCRVDPQNLAHVRAALTAFGPLYIGALLPISAQTQGEWTTPAAALTSDDAPGSWGGHCLVLTAITSSAVTFITWGGTQSADLNWWLAYVDECWAVLSPDWTANGRAPSGFDFAALRDDMTSVSS